MSLELITANLLSPAILFFFLGIIAKWMRSDLSIPAPVSRLLSLYLLFAIGFKGGVELTHSGFSMAILATLLIAVAAAFITPIYSFMYLKRRLDVHNAAALAATYGSISAVTFITGSAFLDSLGEQHGGHMVAAMALMESPAIIVGVLLVRMFNQGQQDEHAGNRFQEVLKEALTNGSVVMILGSLLIGMVASEAHIAKMHPFTHDIFGGVLSLFLLDMGLLAGKRLLVLKKVGWRVVIFGIWLPLINAALGITIGTLMGLSHGDTLLLTLLFASASYIAVPAAVRTSIPKANPGLFVPMALGITFPFNIIIGIPLYYFLIQHFG